MAGGAVKKVPHTRAIGPFYARYSLLNLGSPPPSFLLNAPRAGNRFNGLRRGTERERGESSGDTAAADHALLVTRNRSNNVCTFS